MQRLNCEHFPCHSPDQDCSLCFCPFYPCLDERTGGRQDAGSWVCDSCRFIHIPEVAAMIMDSLMKGDSVKLVWEKFERLL